MLEAKGFTCETEVEFNNCQTSLGVRDYTADIVANLKVIVEIDGKSHWSKNAIQMDSVRDTHFKDDEHALTARLSQFDLVGRKAQMDDLIFAEFLYKIWGLRIA